MYQYIVSGSLLGDGTELCHQHQLFRGAVYLWSGVPRHQPKPKQQPPGRPNCHQSVFYHELWNKQLIISSQRLQGAMHHVSLQ